jgi:hypothetical protein
MHFHKPHLWQGSREFLKEYLIIVVGVLTALVAEQFAEAAHHHAEAAEAQETIRAEVAQNLARVQQRGLADGCVQARLAELGRIVDEATPEGRIRAPGWIGRAPRYAIESARWDAASQSGRVSLLPTDWQARFGLLYTAMRYHYEMNQAEQQTWSSLDGLTGLDRLTPEGKLAIKGQIEQARFYNDSLHQVAGLILRRAAAEGLQPAKRNEPPSSVCWPIDTPTAEGLSTRMERGLSVQK